MITSDLRNNKVLSWCVLQRSARGERGARGGRGSAYHRHSAVHYACLPPRPPPPPRCPPRRGRTQFATPRIEAYSPQTLHEFIHVFLNKLEEQISWNRNYKFALSSELYDLEGEARRGGPPHALPHTTKLDSFHSSYSPPRKLIYWFRNLLQNVQYRNNTCR